MFTSQRMKSSADAETKGNYKMSHSLSMDDARKNEPKKDNNLLGSMMNLLGSVGNIISKIPNFMGSINNTLSVTVVPNEGIISPEYILKNLTGSSEHLEIENTKIPMPIFERIPDERIYNTKRRIVDIIASEIAGKSTPHKFIDRETTITSERVTWFEEYQEPPPSDYDRAIAESLKLMEDNKKKENKELEQKINNSTIMKSNIEFCIDRMRDNKTEEMKIKTKVPDARQESPDSELLAKKCPVANSRRKWNVVAKMRGKGRGRPQLRRSGVSQTKHRKERIRHNLYSNIQDDLEDWEVETNESDDKIDKSSEPETDSRTQESYQIIPNYPLFIEAFILGEPPRSQKWKQKKSNYFYQVRFLPDCENKKSIIPYEIRRRLQSESSIDSEDSCIVFEEGPEEIEYHGGGDDDDDDTEIIFYDSSSEEDTDEDDTSMQKVRFNLQPEVHTMVQWDFAYRAARRGPWEEIARDRTRFSGKIAEYGRKIEPMLDAKHRDCIWRDRFASEK